MQQHFKAPGGCRAGRAQSIQRPTMLHKLKDKLHGGTAPAGATSPGQGAFLERERRER